ncbi:hypothetical protein M0812_13100 [Anaeramoeba flamelloides]|uniref:Uncharacterized protein n=1 Tax=Anaeramoeba flamelloides TaxID=1746091 RepID=A0AAV7ZIL2_9EUKA|nr:hypothetical protein M0812_13100 [Anaeramoeba flamelloides]
MRNETVHYGNCKTSTGQAVQCVCLASSFKVREIIFGLLFILLLLASIYLLFKAFSLPKSHKLLLNIRVVRIFSLSIIVLISIISAFYYLYDPHSCHYRFNTVLNDFFYGLPKLFSVYLGTIVVLWWIDLLQTQKTRSLNMTFTKKVQRLMILFVFFTTVMEIITTPLWKNKTLWFVYMIYINIVLVIIAIAFAIVLLSLMKRFFKARSQGKMQAEIKKLYLKVIIISVICLLVLLQESVTSIISISTSCFKTVTCSSTTEFVWSIDQIIILTINLIICQTGISRVKPNEKNFKNITNNNDSFSDSDDYEGVVDSEGYDNSDQSVDENGYLIKK